MTLTKKVLGLSLAAVVGMTVQVRADDTPSGRKASLESRIQELEAKLKDAHGGGVKGSGIKVSGYVDTSYLVNLADRTTSGPVAGSSRQSTGRVFDNQQDAFNLNAVKLTIQKDKDTSKFPAGFRVDTILGQDANVLDGSNPSTAAAQGSTANSDSALFLEQAYVNLGIPVANGIDAKIGKMVTLMGYEVIESPANWQFSRSDAFRLAPLTQTGVSLGYQFNDTVTLTAALINGLDSLVSPVAAAGTRNGGSVNFNTSLGGVARLDVNGPKTAFGDFNAFAAGFYSNDNTGAPASNDQNISMWNIGGNWDKPFSVKALTLGTEYLQRGDQVTAGTINSSVGASALSIYGKWDWNKWLTSSGRFGYTRYDNANQVATSQSLSPLVSPAGQTGMPEHTDVYSFTLTQAFNVWKDTLVRLEWRHDWTDGGRQGFGTATATGGNGNDIRSSQDTIAVNVVYSF